MPKPPRPPLAGHLPPGIEPRGLSKQAAAEYVGCATIRAFDEQVRKGNLPGPMRGMSRYDRLALDDAMDRLSGRTRPPGAVDDFDSFFREKEAEAILEQWRTDKARATARTERQLRGSLNPSHKRKGGPR